MIKEKTKTLDGIIGIIDIPPVEGRIKEIISIQKNKALKYDYGAVL